MDDLCSLMESHGKAAEATNAVIAKTTAIVPLPVEFNTTDSFPIRIIGNMKDAIWCLMSFAFPIDR